jgi:hypothetical protein
MGMMFGLMSPAKAGVPKGGMTTMRLDPPEESL